jgi:hypothetical protein
MKLDLRREASAGRELLRALGENLAPQAAAWGRARNLGAG